MKESGAMNWKEAVEKARKIELPEGWRPPEPQYKCKVCEDRGVVMYKVDVCHPAFGKLHPCPYCSPEIKDGGFEAIEQFEGQNVKQAERILARCLNVRSGFVYLWGSYGTAKTALLEATKVEAARRAYSVRVLSCENMLDTLRQSYGAGDTTTGTYLRRYIETEYLGLDELDKIQQTDWSSAKIYELIDKRWQRWSNGDGGVTILVGQHAPEQTFAKQPALIDRVRDEMAHVIELVSAVSARRVSRDLRARRKHPEWRP
jgi:DNA replication protein DnaC